MIQQRAGGDCGVAALAMFAQITYETADSRIREHCKREDEGHICGMNDLELGVVLKNMGFDPVRLFTIVDNVPAILTVPSLSTRMLFHYLYWDGKEIRDPQKGKEDCEYYTTEMIQENFPVSTAISCMDTLNIDELETHYYAKYDWND